jgi:hypothetical protein
MLLRDHTLMSYPWIDDLENGHMGEIGILLAVILSIVLPADRCFL